MMEDGREKQFINHARRILDESAAGLDEPTAARLKAARMRALAQQPGARAWLWPAGGLAAAASVAGVVWLLNTQAPEIAGGMDDLDILAAEESLEFYADMDFYDWLEADDLAG